MTKSDDLELKHGATAKARENAVKQDCVHATNAIGHYPETLGFLPRTEFMGGTPCRKLSVSWHEPARQFVRELAKTEAYRRSRRQRYKVERLFGELKTRINLRRSRLRRMPSPSFSVCLVHSESDLDAVSRDCLAVPTAEKEMMSAQMADL